MCRWEDQQRINEKLGLVTVDVKELENVELAKEEPTEISITTEANKPATFSIEYSKSNRSKCKKCDEKIDKVNKIVHLLNLIYDF